MATFLGIFGKQALHRGVGFLAVMALLASWPGEATAAPKAEEDQPFTTGSSDELIDYINQQIRQSWKDNQVSPSPVAEDAEWLRRVYLDIVGHIPPAEVVEEFLEDGDPAKRSKMIDKLLDEPAYVRNWTTIWTNLLIGRNTPEDVSRLGMRKFLREAFSKNRPWNEIVYDLVSAEGHYERNGAVNYLLAQMENSNNAVQATAKTTRLFMGIQVQCTQCHNHPFNEWKQDQFWEFNSFFREASKSVHEKYNPETGEMETDYIELVNRDNSASSGPVYFEKRSGLMKVAYPKFFDKKIDPGAEVNRRQKLAELMTQGDEPWIAKAMVNRMWGHFFGYGFTKPVDDMGPHNPPSHPTLFERLTEEFIKSNYDLKQLVRWITNSEAYNLTSRFTDGNDFDNPAAGETPLFSRMYVKPMTPEQLYNSLIIATHAHKSGRSSWREAQKQRQEWKQQFVVTFDTDMQGEVNTFNGTIPQALMMMNGSLVDNAIKFEKGGYFYKVLTERGPYAKKIRKLYLSTLSRPPTKKELRTARNLLQANRQKPLVAYQDLFWALLNSNEFVLNH